MFYEYNSNFAMEKCTYKTLYVDRIIWVKTNTTVVVSVVSAHRKSMQGELNSRASALGGRIYAIAYVKLDLEKKTQVQLHAIARVRPYTQDESLFT